MNLFELTMALIDIESITNSELQLERYLSEQLSPLATRHGGHLERMEVAPDRANLFITWGNPIVALSTHMDTVPPFFPARDGGDEIWGRGACDTKGIIAAMICAAEKLLAGGRRNFGLLFVVGEERDSAGAKTAAQSPRGARFLINGEPTENKLALASKGALRLEITSTGKAAHSAYPELGQSAIHTLLDVLQDIRRIPLPKDGLFGRCTLNIGVISGGRAPNVVADSASAEIMYRLVGDAGPILEDLKRVIGGRAKLREVLRTPAVRLEWLEGLPTTTVSFTTDIPILGSAWGKPFLIGPGSVHLAHTAGERVPKQQLLEAVEIYSEMVQRLSAEDGAAVRSAR